VRSGLGYLTWPMALACPAVSLHHHHRCCLRAHWALAALVAGWPNLLRTVRARVRTRLDE
jgi:hypothetical protein